MIAYNLHNFNMSTHLNSITTSTFEKKRKLCLTVSIFKMSVLCVYKLFTSKTTKLNK